MSNQSISPLVARMIQFRSFESGDSARVSEIICRCLQEVNSRDYPPDEIAGMLPGFAADRLAERFAGTDAIVAVRNREIYGIGLLAGDEIRTFFVDPDIHGGGIGKALLGHLEDLAWSRGIPKISLSSSVSSKDFYARHGYVLIEEVNHPVGGRMFKMEKTRGS